MPRYGMFIDANSCIGCYTCRTACQNQNKLLPEEGFIRFEEREVGSGSDTKIQHFPLQCMHCEDAPCVSVCPTGASCYGADGIVSVDHGRCIGCLYCVAACPYQVRVRNPQTGGVDKCRFCTVSSSDYGIKSTTCVEACPTHCRIFGDLDDPDSDLVKAIVRNNAAPIAGDLTKAKIFYAR